MSDKIREYVANPDIRVKYDAKRCIHAAECVTRLSSVFDTDKRPWIQPQHASADTLAETIHQCPSGALHYERNDGGIQESVSPKNTITLSENGPLYLRGNLRIYKVQGGLLTETRAALCRCGYSENKPFCDNAHKGTAFKASGSIDESKIELNHIVEGCTLEIIPSSNGPYEVTGDFIIQDNTRRVVFQGNKTWLCRCGGSSNKPFCDGTHNKIGFQAE